MKKSLNASPEVESLAAIVIDAAIEVHRHLGPGWTEVVYEDALCVELGLRNTPYSRQLAVSLAYKGTVIGQGRIDLLVDRLLVVELKSVESLLPVHHAQVLSYLKMTHLELGLLLNFNCPLLKDGIRRIIHQSSPFVSSCLRVEKSEPHHG
jgi:GxxExxY protein